jgi:hypothetical protein
VTCSNKKHESFLITAAIRKEFRLGKQPSLVTFSFLPFRGNKAEVPHPELVEWR